VKTELPTLPADAPVVAEGAPPATRRRRRRRVVAFVVVAVLAGAFWLTAGGPTHTTKVTIDGRPVWVPGPKPTVASALAAGRVTPRDGVLYSAVTRRVLDAHATPAHAFVDGSEVKFDQRVHPGNRIVLREGADAREPVVRRKIPTSGTGLPAVEDRIWVSDTIGYDEVDVGEKSGEIVSRSIVSPAGPVHPQTGMVVALTFDDGPDPRWTPGILQILHDENVKATFCTIGYLAQRHPELVKAERDAGHTMCDHSMHHILRLDLRPHPQIIDEVLQGADVIRSITGENPPFYRPPGGSLNPDIIDTAHQRGLRVLKWSVDPHDYTKPPAPVILARITAAVGPGAVVLLHDGGGDRSQTMGMLKQLIDDLKARGFTFSAWQ
jgi:peptidoglycan/xylan/chitin deacetylase (PgdA/CDA1 family)